MAKDITLIAIHGMGDTPKNYADDLFDEVKDLIKVDQNRVHFGSVYYQDILQSNEEKVFARMKKTGIDYKKIRRFILFGFSDALGLEHRAHLPDSPYAEVQRRIQQCLMEAYLAMGEESKPVIFVAHSLGCQVLSNYIWDSQIAPTQVKRGVWVGVPKENDKVQNFLRLKSLAQLYTTGCNIPIFMSGWDEDDIIPVAKNAKGYQFDWDNYYDEDDVLGWPLKPLSKAYSRVVKKDHEINADGGFFGKLWRGWNPLSHGGYWTDNDFTKPLARKIRRVLTGN